MSWKIEFDKKAAKEFADLDRSIQKQIDKFLQKLLNSTNVRQFGTALTGKLEIWRYRVGDYRLLCSIEDEKLTVLVIKIDHRKQIYKRFKKKKT